MYMVFASSNFERDLGGLQFATRGAPSVLLCLLSSLFMSRCKYTKSELHVIPMLTGGNRRTPCTDRGNCQLGIVGEKTRFLKSLPRWCWREHCALKLWKDS